MAEQPLDVLVICGSLRKGSYTVDLIEQQLSGFETFVRRVGAKG
jgi:NAD(P)H-dependent FMN reductase